MARVSPLSNQPSGKNAAGQSALAYGDHAVWLSKIFCVFDARDILKAADLEASRLQPAMPNRFDADCPAERFNSASILSSKIILESKIDAGFFYGVKLVT